MDYLPPWWLRNGHLQSIYPSLFRKVDGLSLKRIRLDTPDHDFIDLDYAARGHKRIVVITHGLEGHSRRPYCLGMIKAAQANAWDAVAWNFRACSGDPNRKLRSYHSGQTQDLALVIDWAQDLGYEEIALIGFSIGGNKTLLYLGNNEVVKPKNLCAAVAFSVPVDLEACAHHLALKRNRLYMENFLLSFRKKLELKETLFPGQIDSRPMKNIKNFLEYDEQFTAPMNGFRSASHYWEESSSLRQLANIKHPALLINALDDPFLTPECFPREIAKCNPYFELETPKYGGHVGFMSINQKSRYWSESRAMAFLNSHSQTSKDQN